MITLSLLDEIHESLQRAVLEATRPVKPSHGLLATQYKERGQATLDAIYETLKILEIHQPAVNQSKQIKRVDPIGCACTDCITGYSCPINQITPRQARLLMIGAISNATAYSDDQLIQYFADNDIIKIS